MNCLFGFLFFFGIFAVGFFAFVDSGLVLPPVSGYFRLPSQCNGVATVAQPMPKQIYFVRSRLGTVRSQLGTLCLDAY